MARRRGTSRPIITLLSSSEHFTPSFFRNVYFFKSSVTSCGVAEVFRLADLIGISCQSSALRSFFLSGTKHEGFSLWIFFC